VNFTLTKPCAKCPFRTDVRPYLTKGRVRDIEGSLIRGQQTFTCHETTKVDPYDEEGSEMVDGPNAQHCAGAMILLEGLDRPNQMMRIAERLGMYDRRKLDMTSPVFNSFESMRKAQPQ
jgi:hypothetical protein